MWTAQRFCTAEIKPLILTGGKPPSRKLDFREQCIYKTRFVVHVTSCHREPGQEEKVHPTPQGMQGCVIQAVLWQGPGGIFTYWLGLSSPCPAQHLWQAKVKKEIEFTCDEWSIFLLVTSQVWNTAAQYVKEHCKPHWSQMVFKQYIVLEGPPSKENGRLHTSWWNRWSKIRRTSCCYSGISQAVPYCLRRQWTALH